MTFDRAWARRPFASPARWAPVRAVSPLWADIAVTFSRSASMPTPGGGFDRGGGAPDIYLSAYCHAEITESDSPAAMAGGETLVIARWWTIWLPMVIGDAPLDPANYPKKGDKVRFVDDVGISWAMDVRSVDALGPEDHWEILTETFV